jgi:NitT/TauT family transport system permease protein
MSAAPAESTVARRGLLRRAKRETAVPSFALGQILVVAAAALAWAAAAGIVHFWPNDQDIPFTDVLAVLCLVVTGAILVSATVAGRSSGVRSRLLYWVPWLIASALLLVVWEIVTAKLYLLRLPYFPSPQAILSVYRADGSILAESFANSLKLIAIGYLGGASLGVITGVSMGWWQKVNYWMHPILRTIGPVPATAWIPLFFVVFPTSFTASIALIALAAWFPVTILTWSGVASVSKRYYDVALTLGARERFLIWKVAIPAALPNIFVGLFMGLGFSFITIVVAEIFGVDSGLGWYINWVRGWAAYTNMYAAIVLMAILFSALITLLFFVRDRVLSWQKGVIRW